MFTLFECLFAHLQKSKKPQIRHWFWITWGGLVNQKESGFWIQSSKSAKYFLKITPTTIAIIWLSLLSK